jgi:hypothetical protein
VLILDEPFGALDAFTREDLWQTMHEVKEAEPFTGVLITHDLRESIFLADQVVVLSGRPRAHPVCARCALSGPRDLEHLYTPEAAEMLHDLRHQIEIAQGRAPEEDAAPRTRHEICPPPRPAWIARDKVALLAPRGGDRLSGLLVSGLGNDWPNYKMASPSDLPAAYAKYWELFL